MKVLCLHEMLLTVMLHNALLNDAFNGAKETILLWFKNDKPPPPIKETRKKSMLCIYFYV